MAATWGPLGSKGQVWLQQGSWPGSEAVGREEKASPWAYLVPRGRAEWGLKAGLRQAAPSPQPAPWCELLSVLCPAPARRTFVSTAPRPGRTRDGAWALKPGGTWCPAAHP